MGNLLAVFTLIGSACSDALWNGPTLGITAFLTTAAWPQTASQIYGFAGYNFAYGGLILDAAGNLDIRAKNIGDRLAILLLAETLNHGAGAGILGLVGFAASQSAK